MGRPPLGPKIEVRVQPETLARLDALAPGYQRPALIREAIERELARRERAQVKRSSGD